MGFVNGEQSDPHPLEPGKKLVTQQAFGGDVEQVKFSGMQLRHYLPSFGSLERRVVKCSTHAVDNESVDLVFHQ